MEKVTTGSCRRRPGGGILTLLPVVLAMIAFFGWTASPDGAVWRQAGWAEEYYNSEVEGFRSGHLWMALTPLAQLQALPDPYDPAQNAPYRLHDASYYRGHYYLYFGVTPVLLFFWPVEALTGRYASEVQAVLAFSILGYLTSVGLLAAIRRRYFPGVGLGTLAAGAIALGLVTMIPTLLRRPATYEVPISCAYACFMVMLALLWRALHSDRPTRWTIAASLAYGLTIGARPDYAFGAACLLAPLGCLRGGGEGDRRTSAAIRMAAAAIVPLTATVAALLAYNFERFGHPLEFGTKYMLSGMRAASIAQFSPRFLWANCRIYLFSAARLSWYFPYVTVIHRPWSPPGYLGVEDPYGILPNLPFAALALLWPLAAAGRRELGWWLSATTAAALAAALVIGLVCGSASRYMVDFLPAVALLAVVAVLALEQRLRGWALGGARAVWLGTLAWSSIFSVLASIQHNDLLRINHPSAYAPLARMGNLPSYWLDRLCGTKYGPLEITLRFPPGRTGQLEPILVSGAEFKSDFLYVLYADSAHVVFGFEHTGYGGPVTEPVEVDFRAVHHLRVDLASLYPPRDHPYFAGWSGGQMDAHLGRLRLFLDGRCLMDDPVECYDPVARKPWIGVSPDSAALGRRFTGEIEGVRRVPSAAPVPFGALRLYLELSPRAAGTSEPLLTTGVTGRGDLLRLVYVDDRHVRFVHDRWGFGGSSSPDVPIRYGDRHRVELSLGSLYPDGPWIAGLPAGLLARRREEVTVILDGKPVLDVTEPSHPAAPETVAIGVNAIGASLTEPRFTGRILNEQRVFEP